MADDQPAVLESLRLLLSPEGFDLDTANGPDGLIDALQHDHYDFVLMDMNYSSDTPSGGKGSTCWRKSDGCDHHRKGIVRHGRA